MKWSGLALDVEGLRALGVRAGTLMGVAEVGMNSMAIVDPKEDCRELKFERRSEATIEGKIALLFHRTSVSYIYAAAIKRFSDAVKKT
jgi:hypothetical protein